MTQIAVIDYGMGNLHSVSKALEAVSQKENIVITSDQEVIKTSDKLVFPGVGAIKDCMEAFSNDLKETVLEEVKKKPTLAICVGMQMLLESSEENGGVEGLGLLNGKVCKIQPNKDIKVPHMGWNQVNYLKEHFLLENIADSLVIFILFIVIAAFHLKMLLPRQFMVKSLCHLLPRIIFLLFSFTLKRAKVQDYSYIKTS